MLPDCRRQICSQPEQVVHGEIQLFHRYLAPSLSCCFPGVSPLICSPGTPLTAHDNPPAGGADVLIGGAQSDVREVLRVLLGIGVAGLEQNDLQLLQLFRGKCPCRLRAIFSSTGIAMGITTIRPRATITSS
ncbi:MAG: hypothetical protein MZV64_71135 [Ignavibacteriales bacterium]|nr:hypothetical protein [Ignavibacteriales bacterium]